MTFDWSYFFAIAGAIACMINGHEAYFHAAPTQRQAVKALLWLAFGVVAIATQAMHFPAH